MLTTVSLALFVQSLPVKPEARNVDVRKEAAMKSLKKILENVFATAALAEGGVDPASVPSLDFRPVAVGARNWMEDHFVAVALAEANMAGEAWHMVQASDHGRAPRANDLVGFLSDVGLMGVRVRLCVVQV